MALAGLALLSYSGVGEIWNEHIAPRARKTLPADAYSLVERGLGVAFLLLALWLVLRHAPARQRPARWVTSGLRTRSGAAGERAG